MSLYCHLMEEQFPMQTRKSQPAPEQHLFIFGPPRSGTTALARVINSHERIGIGMERFKLIMNNKNIDQFTPDLFEARKLFDFKDGHTNISPSNSAAMKRYYDDMLAKYDNLIYIGDKVPSAFRVAKQIHERFPKTKCVFIIRDIFETACSWQARAEREHDSWPASRTATHAVKPWNVCLKIFLDLQQKYPDNFYMVDYGSFFDGDPQDLTALQNLCRFLNLPADGSMRMAFTGSRNKYQEFVKNKERALDDEALQYIKEHADREAYENAIGAFSKKEFKKAA